MNHVVVGMFDREDQAMAVLSDLRAAGVDDSSVSLEAARGDQQRDSRGFFQKLGDVLSGRDQRTYGEGLRRGASMVSVTTDDAHVDQVIAILERHGAVDVDERSETWRAEGWQPDLERYDEVLEVDRQTDVAPTRTASAVRTDEGVGGTRGAAGVGDDRVALPVVEEQLMVGKREVRRGGVRVFTHVSERPVEESVRLREEHVTVERHPVDRPVKGEPGLFQEGTFEVTEQAEEVVVSREARVVEEVVVGKTVNERTETVRDTVRRTDVDVQPMEASFGSEDFSRYDSQFQTHHGQTFGGAGDLPYEHYQPAYKYGWQLASSDTWRGRPWDDVEPEARRSWETHNPGTWTRFKDAVRYGWDRPFLREG